MPPNPINQGDPNNPTSGVAPEGPRLSCHPLTSGSTRWEDILTRQHWRRDVSKPLTESRKAQWPPRMERGAKVEGAWPRTGRAKTTRRGSARGSQKALFGRPTQAAPGWAPRFTRGDRRGNAEDAPQVAKRFCCVPKCGSRDKPAPERHNLTGRALRGHVTTKGVWQMKSIKIMGLCLVAAMALSAVVSASASAGTKNPKWALCEERTAGTGQWENTTCTKLGGTKTHETRLLLTENETRSITAEANGNEAERRGNEHRLQKTKTQGGGRPLRRRTRKR